MTIELRTALGGWSSFDLPIAAVKVFGDRSRDPLLLLLGHRTPHPTHELEPFAHAHHDVEG